VRNFYKFLGLLAEGVLMTSSCSTVSEGSLEKPNIVLFYVNGHFGKWDCRGGKFKPLDYGFDKYVGSTIF